MEEMMKKKLFVQLQFCTLLLVCTLLPDFGSMLSSAFGLGGLSIVVIVSRIIGLVGAGMALYSLYTSSANEGQHFPSPYLYSLGGGLVLTLISLIPDIPVWLDYVALIALLVGMYLGKSSLSISWKTLSTQGAYLILLASLLHLYSDIDSKISTNVAALVGFIIYLVGLGKLSRSLDDKGKSGVTKLKIAVIIGIIAALFGLLPLVGGIIAAIFRLIAFIFEFLGYTNLKNSETLNEQGRSGASTLRVSMILMVLAVLLGLIPLMGSTIAGVLTLIALWFVFKGWRNILFGLEN